MEILYFKHYYSNPINPDNFITQDVFAIYEDREETLWIGTYGEGLVAFNRQTNELTIHRNRPDDPNSLSDNKIWSICQDQQGMLWIGTAEGGLNQLHHKPDEPEPKRPSTDFFWYLPNKNTMWVKKYLKRRGCGESFLRHMGCSEY